MSHTHIHLAHYARQNGQGIKARGLKGKILKPVRPSRRNEHWYQAQLLAIVKQLRASARRHLLPALKADGRVTVGDFDVDQPRDETGRWSLAEGGTASSTVLTGTANPSGTLGHFNPNEGGVVFHGTSRGGVNLKKSAGTHLYLTTEHEEAVPFALDNHRYGAKAAIPVTRTYAARPGKTVDIDQDIMSMLESGSERDEKDIMQAARDAGARYATHFHPSGVGGHKDGFTALISLYPHEDLRLIEGHQVAHDVAAVDSLSGSQHAALAAISKDFGGIERVAQRLSALAVQRNLEAVDTQLTANIQRAIGVNVEGVLTNDGDIRQAIEQATAANVALITSLPEEYLDKLGKVLNDNLVDGARYDSLADYVEHVADVTESRAKLIGRDQTSKMNSSFNQVRQTSLGIERYDWQTAGDERVRESHADHDGQTFSWDNPPEDTGNPGEDIQCRCVALPHFDLEAEEEALGLSGDEQDDEG